MENIADIEIEDVRRSGEYAKYMGKIGWRVVGGVFIRRLGPVAIAKIQRVKIPVPWEKINGILKRERVFMCKLEPETRLSDGQGGRVEEWKKYGFRQDNSPLLGTKTLRVDLRPSEETIFNSFKKDARYCIRQATNLKSQTRLPDGQVPSSK